MLDGKFNLKELTNKTYILQTKTNYDIKAPNEKSVYPTLCAQEVYK